MRQNPPRQGLRQRRAPRRGLALRAAEGGSTMPRYLRSLLRTQLLLAALTVAGTALAQSPPNPYRQVEGWAKLNGGRQIGAVGDVDVAPDGKHIWALLRCDAGGDKFTYECLDSNLDVVFEFDADGNQVAS